MAEVRNHRSDLGMRIVESGACWIKMKSKTPTYLPDHFDFIFPDLFIDRNKLKILQY
jgi:hypothetical protein